MFVSSLLWRHNASKVKSKRWRKEKGIWKTWHTCTQMLAHTLSHREHDCIRWILIQVLLIFLHRWQNTSCWSKAGLPFLHYFSYLYKYAQYQSLNILEWCRSPTPNIKSAAMSSVIQANSSGCPFISIISISIHSVGLKTVFAFCFCVQAREQTTINLYVCMELRAEDEQ